MKGFLFLSAFVVFSLTSFGQLQGTFAYKATITMPDSIKPFREWKVNAYTNDTIVRVETQGGQFGTQVYIRHMVLNKAYLLLVMSDQKFAIQTDLEKNKKPDTAAKDYTFKRKWFGGKKIAGYKCRKYYILDKGETEGYYCYFAKKISNKYLEVYRDIPGLALDYYLPSQDGLIHYQMLGFKASQLDRDLFGVPSDFKKVTFEQFMNAIETE
jgi:hypothetical protein